MSDFQQAVLPADGLVIDTELGFRRSPDGDGLVGQLEDSTGIVALDHDKRRNFFGYLPQFKEIFVGDDLGAGIRGNIV